MGLQRRGIVRTVISVLVAGVLAYVAASGLGPLPPLGPAFNPGTGVWTVAADAALPRSGTLHLAGLNGPVQVIFERNGTAHVQAGTDHDLFWTIGYLHARFRLFQMDLLRRQGEGLLSEVVGPQALQYDQFEDELGLGRTAQAEWRATARGSAAWQALQAYAQGVNARINEDEQANNLPLMFKMLGYQPRPWTPVDSLVIQGDMVQLLDLTATPLDYALLVKALGYGRTMDWFPVLPPNAQQPYDTGPYQRHAPAPLPSQLSASAVVLPAVSSLVGQLAALAPGTLHQGGGNSNNWAVSGSKTASGRALLAGDPHLHQTLPAIWYQVGGDAPDYHFNGVGIPGVPVILIGRNRHIAWSLTNVQNQATLFYVEKTDKAHPNQYYWRGAWRHMQSVSYNIPVKGGPTSPLTVQLSVHGPILTDDRLPGQTLALDWMGALPSQDIDAALGIIRASTFSQFRDALRAWHVPSQNFVYADDRGHIGMVSAGYYPLVKSGSPWLPLPGTGEADVVGTIPFDDIPQVYDPPGHVVFSANQRPVGPGYPYYIGTSWNFFANGYRANRISSVLQKGQRLTAADMERLQTDTHDYLAALIVPRLLAVLDHARLSAREAAARSLLQSWDDDMGATAPAASVWWTFWSQYLHDTFQPWWNAEHVPAAKFNELSVDPSQAPLDEDLETWTLHDPTNAAFSPPHGSRRTASDVMLAAFKESVTTLARQLGADPGTWHWDRLQAREFDSLAQAASLSYGPRGSSGDLWTVNAADGYPVATSGPSWRFVMDWGSGSAVGVYPGGQSENPLSPWYENEVSTWWDGHYYPMLDATTARAQPGSIIWTLTPSGS